jgi:hypothetical protein
MNNPQDEEKNSESSVKRKPKEVISAWWGDLAFAASVFLILLYAIVITILRRFGITAAPWTMQVVISTMLLLWGIMGLVIVIRGEYRDRHKGIQRGFPAYVLGSTLMVIGWSLFIGMLISILNK